MPISDYVPEPAPLSDESQRESSAWQTWVFATVVVVVFTAAAFGLPSDDSRSDTVVMTDDDPGVSQLHVHGMVTVVAETLTIGAGEDAVTVLVADDTEVTQSGERVYGGLDEGDVVTAVCDVVNGRLVATTIRVDDG